MFSTVHSNEGTVPEEWTKIITSPSARLRVWLDEEDSPELDDEWLSEEERFEKKAREQAHRMSITGNRSTAPEISEGTQWVPDQHQETTD